MQPKQLPPASNARPDDITVDIAAALFANVSPLTESQRLLVSLFSLQSNGAFWNVMEKLELGTAMALRASCRYARSNVALSAISTLRVPLPAASGCQLITTAELGEIYPSAKKLRIVFPQAGSSAAADEYKQQVSRNVLVAQLERLQHTAPKLLQQLHSIHIESTTCEDYDKNGCIISLLTSWLPSNSKLAHLHLSFSGCSSSIELEEEIRGAGLSNLSQLTSLQSGLLASPTSASPLSTPTTLPAVFTQLSSFTTGNSGLPLFCLLPTNNRLHTLDIRSAAALDHLPQPPLQPGPFESNEPINPLPHSPTNPLPQPSHEPISPPSSSITTIVLRIPRTQRITQSRSLALWLSHHPCLKHLSLNTHVDALGDILSAAAPILPPSLKSLTLTNIHPEDTLPLRFLTSLTSLSLYLNSSAPTRFSFDFLTSLPNLRTFCLRSTSTALTPSLLSDLCSLTSLTSAVLPLQPTCRWSPPSQSPFTFPKLSSLIFLLPACPEGEHPVYELPPIQSSVLESLSFYHPQPTGFENPLLEPSSVLTVLEACPWLSGLVPQGTTCALVKQLSPSLHPASPVLLLDYEMLQLFAEIVPDSLNHLELCIPDDAFLPLADPTTPPASPHPVSRTPPLTPSPPLGAPSTFPLLPTSSSQLSSLSSGTEARTSAAQHNAPSYVPGTTAGSTACDVACNKADNAAVVMSDSPWVNLPSCPMSLPTTSTMLLDTWDDDMCISPPNPSPLMSNSAPAAYVNLNLVLDDRLTLPVYHPPVIPQGLLDAALHSTPPPSITTFTTITIIPPITSFRLSNSLPFSPQTLSALPPSLPNIRTLYLPNITDEALHALSSNCPHLSELAIEDSSSLSDGPLQQLARTHSTTLVHLRLYFAGQVTNKGIAALSGMQSLNQLYLHGAPHVDVEAARKLLAAPALGLLVLKDVGVKSLEQLVGSWGLGQQESERVAGYLSAWVVVQP